MPPAPQAPDLHRIDPALATSGRIPLYGGLLVCAAMFAYSWVGDHYLYAADDAGITMRYAERMAAGWGFGYNDGESVNGASNPLYVLTAAALLRLGLGPETSILLIASACLALTAGVLFATFARFYSLGAAAFSVLALVAFDHPFDSVADGMEAPIVMLLAVLLFRALHGGGQVLPGIVLGCLVANKLDGALAAIAFTAVYVVALRSFPWRAAATALLAAAPVFGVLLASFGSILPNSMIVKVTLHSKRWDMDRLWMHTYLMRDGFGLLYWGAWSSLLWLPLSRELKRSFAVAVIQAWFVLHMVTFACVNLGDSYPWYAAAPRIHSVILSAFVVHVLASAVVARVRLPRLEWDPRRRTRRTWPVAVLCVAALAGSRYRCIAARLRSPSPPHGLAESASWNLGRQSAGAWLRKHTSGTEVFALFEGLPAYEYGGPVYDYSLLNSARDNRRQALATYALTGPLAPHLDPAPVLEGRDLVASFRFDASLGRYLLYAAPGSEIHANGARHFVFPTPALASGRPGGKRWRSIEPQGNAWRVPTDVVAYFRLRAPLPPTLLFTPRLVGENGAPAAASSSVSVILRVNGVELEASPIDAGSAPRPRKVTAAAADEEGWYTFEIECRSQSKAASEPLLVDLHDVLLRCGEPLRSGDFKLTTERARARIDYVASAGLPYRAGIR